MEEIMQIKTVTGRHSGSEVRWCFDRRSALGLGLWGARRACSGCGARAVTSRCPISFSNAIGGEVPEGDSVANGSGAATGIRALSYSRPAIESNQADRPLR